MIGMGFGFGGLPMYSFGVFVAPLVSAFGWTLADVGAWTFFANLGYVVVAAFAGHVTDRVGVRLVLMLAIPLLSLALGSMGLMGPHLWVLYSLGVIVGCVGAGTTALTYARAVNSWFDAGRGTALGFTSAGIGLTSMVTPLLLQTITTRYGWRVGFFSMALLAISALPVSYFWITERNKPRTLGANLPDLVGDTRAMAMRRPVFWVIACGYLATNLANGGIVTYLVSFLSESGLSASKAAAYAGLLGVASMLGRLTGGFVIDRLHFALVCGVLLFAQAGACVALALHQIAYAPLLILVIGFALGVEVDSMTYSTARYYGMRAFSQICGILGLLGGVGLGLGSVIFGRLASTAGHYSTAFFACAVLVAIGALLFASAYRYPFLETRPSGK